MKKMMMMFAVSAAMLLTGCSVTKVEYENSADGVCKYSIYHNDHWLNRDTGAMGGGMTKDGRFEVKLENTVASPSEEFNRMMNTTFAGFAQLARLAAACYSPGTASIPLTNEAADSEAVAKLVEAQAAAKSAEIAAKSQRETARIKAQSDAAIAEKQATATNGTAANCTDGNCGITQTN